MATSIVPERKPAQQGERRQSIGAQPPSSPDGIAWHITEMKARSSPQNITGREAVLKRCELGQLKSSE
jgi:hypothetical protein